MSILLRALINILNQCAEVKKIAFGDKETYASLTEIPNRIIIPLICDGFRITSLWDIMFI